MKNSSRKTALWCFFVQVFGAVERFLGDSVNIFVIQASQIYVFTKLVCLMTNCQNCLSGGKNSPYRAKKRGYASGQEDRFIAMAMVTIHRLGRFDLNVVRRSVTPGWLGVEIGQQVGAVKGKTLWINWHMAQWNILVRPFFAL